MSNSENVSKYNKLMGGEMFNLKHDPAQENLRLKSDLEGNVYVESQLYKETIFGEAAKVVRVNHNEIIINIERIGIISLSRVFFLDEITFCD